MNSKWEWNTAQVRIVSDVSWIFDAMTPLHCRINVDSNRNNGNFLVVELILKSYFNAKNRLVLICVEGLESFTTN